MNAIDRRRFLQLGLGGAAALAAGPLARPAGAAEAPFLHGVASGDPLPDGVVLWTRVTPSSDATPGSGLGAPTAVTWQVARDAAFSDVVASGAVTTDAASDHTVKVDVGGLAPATQLHYRFVALGATSPVGRFRTAPAPSDARPLRFGVVSCSNWEGGFFSAYRHLAARDDLDAVLHLGDYVYEYEVGRYGPGASFGRVHDPDVEMTVLEHYRRRHALYKTDPDLQALHARYAMVATIDDHETTDNSWSGGAANHQPGEGDWATRRALAMQAYFEWMPIRATGGAGEPARIWRGLRYGGLADVFVLDERTYRSEPLTGLHESLFVTDPAVHDPARTMLGSEQVAWLEDGLRASAATWKVVVNPVMFAPLVLADLPDADPAAPIFDAVFANLGVAPPVVLNGDQWDGYAAEQARVRSVFAEVGGVAVVTGDIHSSWAAEIPADPATYAATGASAAVEFVTPAVTSDSFSAAVEGAGVPGGSQLAPLLPTIASGAGPWIKYLDAERHGFGVLDVAADAVRFDWFHISDRTDPAAAAAHAAAWRSPKGSNLLERVAGPALQEPPGAGGPGSPSGEPSPGPVGGAPPTGDPGRIAATGAELPTLAAAAAAVAAAAAAARSAVRRSEP